MKGKQGKEPVRLRCKKLKNGNLSLYLDIYRNGVRNYEFLKLYITNSTIPEIKARNREILQTAQAIKSQRNVEVVNGRYDFLATFKLDTNFIDYYNAFKETKKKSDKVGAADDEKDSNYSNWDSALKHLLKYSKASTTFREVTKKFAEGFKDYLSEEARTTAGVPLSQNTQHSYFCKFAACIKQAYKDHVIPEDVCNGIEFPKAGEPDRDYLTIDEVRALARTECRYPMLKSAFLFSCLSGMRWSDIMQMQIHQVLKAGFRTRIKFEQRKTKGQEYLDLSEQATALLPDITGRDLDERVFKGLKYSTYHNVALLQWSISAGINKHITFHCGRHTFAIMMLDLGADIFTVSKLLGHRDIKTTLIYAKVLDKRKQEAVDRIPDIIVPSIAVNLELSKIYRATAA